jgi:hypothetical protein
MTKGVPKAPPVMLLQGNQYLLEDRLIGNADIRDPKKR